MNVIEASGLGKRYGRHWALRECALAVPAGRVVALIGVNGAGKSTLLHLAAGLSRPSAGTLQILNGLRPGSAAALAGLGFVAQDARLYQHLSVAETLRLARNLNRVWDQPRALARLADLEIPLRQRVGRLSGGQQAQLALTVALAKRPRLLLLDEPLAWLDPLARHDFLASLMTAVAEEGLSVVFSSHILAELERVADYLILLSRGRVQLAGDADELLACHRVLTGPAGAGYPAGLPVVHAVRSGLQAQLLVRTAGPAEPAPPGWEASPPTQEELVLGYLREPAASALPGPAAAPVVPT